MREYSFLSCHKEHCNGSSYLFPGAPRSYRMSPRLARVLERFWGTYSDAFPKAPAPRIGIILEPRNGASGYWSVAEPGVGPIFVIELDPAIDGKEEIIAHELSHPILRFLGVPTGLSLGSIDGRIGDEFTSTSHHPFIFDFLDQVGYGDEQRASYVNFATEELNKLRFADFSATTYTAPPGQTWLALWYFNFYLLARDEYEAIYAIHKDRAPQIAEKMDLVLDSWMDATKSKGVIKRSAPTQCIRSFQSHLFNRLDLEGRIGFQSLNEWGAWLFQ